MTGPMDINWAHIRMLQWLKHKHNDHECTSSSSSSDWYRHTYEHTYIYVRIDTIVGIKLHSIILIINVHT